VEGHRYQALEHRPKDGREHAEHDTTNADYSSKVNRSNEEVRWRDDVLRKNAAYEVMLAKAAGRSPEDHPDMLVDDLQDGRLPQHMLEASPI